MHVWQVKFSMEWMRQDLQKWPWLFHGLIGKAKPPPNPLQTLSLQGRELFLCTLCQLTPSTDYQLVKSMNPSVTFSSHMHSCHSFASPLPLCNLHVQHLLLSVFLNVSLGCVCFQTFPSLQGLPKLKFLHCGSLLRHTLFCPPFGEQGRKKVNVLGTLTVC